MKLIEADKVKRVMKDYWKVQVDKALTLTFTDGNEANKRINSYIEHNHELLKAIDELPSAEPDTTTHDSIPAETGKNDGDRTSGDCISRQAAIYIASGYCHPANIAKELAKLPSAQPKIIRCKDCAYCDSDVVDSPYGMTNKVWWCDRLYAGANENLIVEPDDFCSFAERREDATD